MKIPNNIINLSHIFVQGSLLSYIGFTKTTNFYVYLFLFLLSLSIIIIVPFPNLNNTTYWNMIKVMHYLLILPFLLYISYLGIYENISSNTYNMLAMIGLFIIMYHSYRIFLRIYS